MKVRWSLVVVLVLACVAGARAFDDFVQIVVSNTAGGVGFASASIDPIGQPPITIARCRVRGAQISYTLHGVAPTTTYGTFLEVPEYFEIIGHERLQKFKAIRTGSTDGGVDCNLSSELLR